MYVYSWHEPRYRAIKVGMGRNPQRRMYEYAEAYGLQFDFDSLWCTRIPRGAERTIEDRCHDALRKHGLEPLLVPGLEGGTARELFRLGNTAYTDAARIVRERVEKLEGYHNSAEAQAQEARDREANEQAERAAKTKADADATWAEQGRRRAAEEVERQRAAEHRRRNSEDLVRAREAAERKRQAEEQGKFRAEAQRKAREAAAATQDAEDLARFSAAAKRKQDEEVARILAHKLKSAAFYDYHFGASSNQEAKLPPQTAAHSPTSFVWFAVFIIVVLMLVFAVVFNNRIGSRAINRPLTVSELSMLASECNAGCVRLRRG